MMAPCLFVLFLLSDGWRLVAGFLLTRKLCCLRFSSFLGISLRTLTGIGLYYDENLYSHIVEVDALKFVVFHGNRSSEVTYEPNPSRGLYTCTQASALRTDRLSLCERDYLFP